MYAIIRDGRVYNTGTLESMFISNVFPPSGTPEWLEDHHVYEVADVAYDPQTEVLVACEPVINGRTVTLHQPAPKPVVFEPVVETVDLTYVEVPISSAADSVFLGDSVGDSIG